MKDLYDINDVYKKYRKEHKKQKSMALLYAMQEIELSIKEADVNANFIWNYKFYKIFHNVFNVAIQCIVLGVAAGAVSGVMFDFVDKIKDIPLFTVSNLLFTSVGVFGLIFLYAFFGKHTYFCILMPYTINCMEEKIKAFNKSVIAELEETEEKPKLKVKVKKKK